MGIGRGTRGALVLGSMLVAVLVTVGACGDDDAIAPANDGGGTDVSTTRDATSDLDITEQDAGTDADGGPDYFVDPLGTNDQTVSGTRIKAVRFRTVDGVRWLQRLRDVQLDLTCQFALATDGKIRCLPRTADPVYLASDCMGAQGVAVEACSAGAFFSESPATCSPTGARTARKLGAPTAATVRYVKSGAFCRALPLPSGFVIRAIGDVEPPATFAEAQTIDFPAPAGPTLRTIAKLARTNDGATGFYSLWDHVANEACVGNSAPGGGVRCYPAAASATQRYADVNCMTRLASFDPTCPDPTLVRQTISFPDGGFEAHVFAAGPRHDGGIYANSGTCQLTADTGNYITPGVELPLDSFQRGTQTITPTGQRRLHLVGTDFGTFRVSSSTSLHDSLANASCQLHLTGPDTAVCVHGVTGASAIDVFSDSACTQSLQIVRVDTAGATRVVTATSTCPTGPVSPVAMVGAPRTQSHYVSNNGVCTEVQPAGFAEVGAPADVSAFEKLTREP